MPGVWDRLDHSSIVEVVLTLFECVQSISENSHDHELHISHCCWLYVVVHTLVSTSMLCLSRTQAPPIEKILAAAPHCVVHAEM